MALDPTLPYDADHDPELEAYEAELRRKEARLAGYLRVRGAVGLVLVALGVGVALVAAGVLLTALGVTVFPALVPWTEGFNAVLATLLPSALALILVRTGLAFWQQRRPETSQPGCPV